MYLQSCYQNKGKAYLNISAHVFGLYKAILNRGGGEWRTSQETGHLLSFR
jgi:hypothetical protein